MTSTYDRTAHKLELILRKTLLPIEIFPDCKIVTDTCYEDRRPLFFSKKLCPTSVTVEKHVKLVKYLFFHVVTSLILY